MKNFGIWIRVSTEDQAKGESPEHHEKRARMYAEVKGWNIKEVYHLEGVSGKSVWHHHETKRMLKDIERGHIQGLIFSKIARLARNTGELLQFADYFKKHNADLISIHEAIDTTSPSGRFVYTLISAMAQWEREEIAERVAASVPVRAKMGKPLGGAAPFGYAWEGKEMVINEEEAIVRRLMYDLFLEVKRKKTVAEKLNTRGHRTRKGSKFTATTVRRLLEDPIAKGLRRANYTKSLGEGKKWEEKPKEDWVFHQVPAIISEEKWDKVQAILADQSKKWKQAPSNTKVHLFTKVLKCSCGGSFFMNTSLAKYVCRECKKKMPKDDLEFIYHEQLKGYVLSKENLEKHLSESTQIVLEKERQLQTIYSKCSELEEKLNNLISLHEKGEIPTEGFGKHYNPIYEQLSHLKESAPEVEGEIAALKELQHTNEYVFEEALNLYNRWPSLSHTEKFEIINAITDSIVIDDEDIIINLIRLMPPNYSIPQLATNGERNHRGSCWLST